MSTPFSPSKIETSNQYIGDVKTEYKRISVVRPGHHSCTNSNTFWFIRLQNLATSSSPGNCGGLRLGRLWPRKIAWAYPNTSSPRLNKNDISLSTCQRNHVNVELGHSESTYLHAWNTDSLAWFKVNILNLNVDLLNWCSVHYSVNLCWISFAET